MQRNPPGPPQGVGGRADTAPRPDRRKSPPRKGTLPSSTLYLPSRYPRRCAKRTILHRACRKASCSTECHKLYLLDVKDYLKAVFEVWPHLEPEWHVRVSFKQAKSRQEVEGFRSAFTDQLSRKRIPYATLVQFRPYPHIHCLIRGGTRVELAAALQKSAAAAGVSVAGPAHSIAPIRGVVRIVHYLGTTKQVRWPAPKGFRVFAPSYKFCPMPFTAGKIYVWKQKAGGAPGWARVGVFPGSRQLKKIGDGVRARYDKYHLAYGMSAPDRQSRAPSRRRATRREVNDFTELMRMVVSWLRRDRHPRGTRRRHGGAKSEGRGSRG